MSENLSRRGILRLGSFASGLLLPIAGGKALSLMEPRKAAGLAITATALPQSTEHATFWQAAEEHAYLSTGYVLPGEDVPTAQKVFSARRRKVEEAAARVWQRPCCTWADVVERAEIAWMAAPKEEMWWPGRKHYEGRIPQRFTGRLAKGQEDPEMHHNVQMLYGHMTGWFSQTATAELIEGVLELAGGRQFSPPIEWDKRRTVNEGGEWFPRDVARIG